MIVSCHWGIEYDYHPNTFQKNMAKQLADAGADVIIGTHTHTLQDVEYIQRADGKRTLVAYSLGNFISGMLEEETQLGGMLTFDFVRENDKVKIAKKPIPIKFDTLYSEKEMEYKNFRYTPDLKRQITIIDPDTAEEVKPILYFDDKTNEVKGKCKLKPYKSYFSFEIRDKKEDQ